MSVWYCVPSKRPVPEAQACVDAWRDMGYKVAVMREQADGNLKTDAYMAPLYGKYMGWAGSVNALVSMLIPNYPEISWLVTGGDDYWPDPHKRADEIAYECGRHFGEQLQIYRMEYVVCEPQIPQPSARMPWSTFGVMQPTGDPWADHQGRIIERIAGSPWMGREWCKRAYGGNGPLPPYYHHNFADEELQLVAQKLGVFWQRPDLNQEHRHWGRGGRREKVPEWWDANCGVDFHEARRVFNERKAAGFPSHEPLEVR